MNALNRSKIVQDRRGARHEITEISVPLVTALVSTGLLAHHGAVTNSALYRTDEILELEGELIEVLWQNPHTRGRLSVVNDAGDATVWEVELGPGPNSMARWGLAAEDFLGQVRIAGHVARRGANGLGALDLQFTDRGRELQAAYDPLEDNIEVVECRQGMPDAMFDPVPMDIVNEGDRIIIHIEQYNTRRTVYMDPEAAPAEPVPSDTGHSTGRWEGDTLVATTTHIG